MYSYSIRDFQFYKNPTEIDIKNQKIILNQGYVYNIIKILEFESVFKLFFEDGTSIIAPEYSLQLIKDNEPQTLSINKFDYYKEISKIVSVKTEEEKSYANNDWTHIDFVIFNKMDKKMVLAIEVDGYYYHKEGTKQQERDKLKDRILGKYEIPLIRFSTTGNGEKKILEEKIRKIFAN